MTITGETLIKGLFYFMLKAKGGKYLSRKQVAGKNGKTKWVYTYASKKGEKSKAPQEQPKPVKQSKPKADKKGMKIEEMPLDDLISLYKEIKNKKGDKPDKVYNLIVQKDMENAAKPYKDKAAEYMSKNDVKEGDTIDGITIGKGRKGYYATANEEYSGTPSMKQVQGMKSLKQAVAVAMAIKDSDNGWIKGKAERKPLSEVAHYFE